MIAANRIEISPLVAELCSAKVDGFGKFVQKLTNIVARRPDGNALRYMSCVNLLDVEFHAIFNGAILVAI